MQDILEKKMDLDYIYDMAQQAAEAGDIDQAIKLSERGLKEAELQADTEWTPKFEMLASDIKATYSSPEPEIAVILRDKKNLTKVKGVGPTHAINLREAGYNTIEQIANTSPKILASVKGIGLETAKKFVKAAQEYMGSSINFKISDTKNDYDSEPLKKPILSQILLSKYTSSETEMEESPQDEPIEIETKEGDSLIQEISTIATKEGFHIIPQTAKGFENILSDLDLTVIKVIETRESKSILLICPIKVNSLKDGMIISEQKVKYDTISEHNLQLDAWIEELRQVQQVLLESITQGRHLLHYLQQFLMMEMDIIDNISHKVSLYSGSRQFKLYIDPIFISESEIQFIEKSLPFAYQRRSNIHFIEASQLPKLLGFLERKYYNIEKYSNEEPAEKILYEAQENFKKKIRIYSIPLAVFGALILILALSQLGFLLQTFIGLSYGVLGVYAGVVSYFYYSFRSKKHATSEGSTIPYYQRPVQLDDTSVEIISQEFPDDLMLQFGYECFGKTSSYKILNRIEQKHAEQYSVENPEQDYNELFEGETERSSEIDHEYMTRFGDFLDD